MNMPPTPRDSRKPILHSLKSDKLTELYIVAMKENQFTALRRTVSSLDDSARDR